MIGRFFGHHPKVRSFNSLEAAVTAAGERARVGRAA
jgi:hypothetical protein